MHRLKSYSLIASLTLIGWLSLIRTGNAVAFAPAFLPEQEEKVAWEKYSTNGEEFSVLMPELPGVIKSEQCLDVGCRNKRLENTYAAYSNGVVYLVTSYYNPFHPPSLEEIIAEKMSPALIDSATTIKSELKLNKFKGQQYIYPAETYGYDVWTAFYLTDERVYEVTAVGGSRKDSAIQKFFKSFALGSKKGKEIGDGARAEVGSTAPESKPAPPKPAASPDRTVPGVSGGGTGGGTRVEAGRPQVFRPNEVTRKAVIIIKPAPAYTEEARQNQVTGTATLQMVFAASGKVTNIRVISSLPNGLTEKAIAAARKIYFIPAIKDGKHVSQYIRVEYNFNIY